MSMHDGGTWNVTFTSNRSRTPRLYDMMLQAKHKGFSTLNEYAQHPTDLSATLPFTQEIQHYLRWHSAPLSICMMWQSGWNTGMFSIRVCFGFCECYWKTPANRTHVISYYPLSEIRDILNGQDGERERWCTIIWPELLCAFDKAQDKGMKDVVW